jgi:putative isomerase
MTTLDLSRNPFSRFGSYITVMEHRPDSPRKPAGLAPGVWLSGVHGFHAARETFRIVLCRDGREVPFKVKGQPSKLIFRADGGTVELCIAEPELVRVRARGVTLRLALREAKYNYVIKQPGPRWLVNTSQAFLFYTAYSLAGDFKVGATCDKSQATGVALVLTPPPGGEAELALHQHVGFAEPRMVGGSFDEAVRLVASEFDAFAAPCRQAAGAEWTDTIDRAALLNWSCVVGPRGHFQRPSMLMSKNWMSNVWGWDHAINALALSEHHPELAWDQLLTIFDQQLPTGQIPDFINDAVRLYNYIKPPIHGWILGLMLDRNPWFDDPARLAAFYGPLERWTEWWFRFRMREGSGLPEYYHGNDSGWDNGTVFDTGTPAASPDAAAFMVLQMEMLARLARGMGKAKTAETWLARSQDMLAKLLRHLWNGCRFVVLNGEGKIAERSDSIFGSLPIVLGKRLPAEVRAALVAEIRRHVTEWGLATEHPASPLYEKAGYWRGPIWAPPTLIVVEGLKAAGETGLAADIAGRYCRLCQKSGFAENFDALSGEPLCDPAYTWTASVFLEMRRETC